MGPAFRFAFAVERHADHAQTPGALRFDGIGKNRKDAPNRRVRAK
jgi:hypothetical protein